jgi:hypothetical protein
VTPRPTVNKRAPAKAKKKKGLEGYFGTGARVPPPNREGTPIDAVGKRRGEEDRTNARTAWEGGRTPDLMEQGHRDKSNKRGEGDKRGNREKSTPNLEGTPIDEVDRRRGGEDKASDCTGGEGESLLAPTAHGDKDNSNKGGEGDQRGNRQKSTSNLERTSIGAGGRKIREVEKATNRTGGKRDPPIDTTAHGHKTKSNKGGEGDQRRTREKLPTKSKSPPTKIRTANSPDEARRRVGI